jgi:hypothetical protein
MNSKRSILRATLFLAAMAASLTLASAARAQEAFAGKFTLTSPVSWNKTTLPAGTYSIHIESTTAFPIMADISRDDSTSSFRTRVLCIGIGDYRNGSSALHLTGRKGALVVHSLVLANLKKEIVYERSVPRESIEEARVNASVPVLVAKK